MNSRLRPYSVVVEKLRERGASIVYTFEAVNGDGYVVATADPEKEPDRTIYWTFDWRTRP